MVDTKVPMQIWKIKRIDIIPYAISFFGTFYQLEAGVLSGAVVALIIMISNEVHPKNEIDYDTEGTTATIHLKGNMTYPGVEYIKELLATLMEKHPSLKIINIDMGSSYKVDYAVVIGLKSAVNDVEIKNVHLKFVNFAESTVREIFLKAGLEKSIGYTENCRDGEEMINTRNTEEEVIISLIKETNGHLNYVENIGLEECVISCMTENKEKHLTDITTNC